MCKNKNKKLINPVIEYPPKPYNFLLFYRYVHPVLQLIPIMEDRQKINIYAYLEAPQLYVYGGFYLIFFNFTYQRAINGRVNFCHSNPLALISASNRFKNIHVLDHDDIPTVLPI